MLIAIEENLLPGKTIAERFENCKRFGFEGIEIRGKQLLPNLEEYKRCSDVYGIPIKAICLGWDGSLLDSDPASRETAMKGIIELLRIGHDLGGAHLVFPPVFGPPKIPNLSPFMTEIELEEVLLIEQLKIIARETAGLSSKLLIEPLNRYEMHLLNRVEQAGRIAREVNAPNIRILADVFHMNIEEWDMYEPFREWKDYIEHIHFADNNRSLPGQGCLDFPKIMRVIHEIGFDKTISIECIRWKKGDPFVELPKCYRFLAGLRKELKGV